MAVNAPLDPSHPRTSWAQRLRAAAYGVVTLCAAPALSETIDLSGRWSIDFFAFGECTLTVTQKGPEISMVVGDCIPTAVANGVIDPATGAFSLSGSCTVNMMNGPFTIAGTLDGPGSLAGDLTCEPAYLGGINPYTAARTCPDGEVTAPEACDDGNLQVDDGCNNYCQASAAVCDDGDACTRSIMFPNLQCMHFTAPTSACRTAPRSLLMLRNDADDTRDVLRWKWLRGAATTQAEFGLPTGSSAATLCVFNGVAGTVLGRVKIPPDPLRWQPIDNRGWTFRDVLGSAGGIRKVVLKGGAAGRAKVVIKGKGNNLPDPPAGAMPFANLFEFPIVQLFDDDTHVCWSSQFSQADVKRNTAEQFIAAHQGP